MKSFKNFIKESFSITRVNMPQIDDVDGFCTFIEQHGISCERKFGFVNHLKPSQSEGFNEYKIRNVMMDMRKDPDSINNMKPIITNGEYVIDGHHRYLAAMRAKEMIPYIEVGITANKLLKLAYEYTSQH